MSSLVTNKRASSARWAGLVVVMLLLQGSGALQAIHLLEDHHHPGDDDQQPCSLCVLFHTAIALPPAPEPMACYPQAIAIPHTRPVGPRVCNILPIPPVRGPPLS